MTAEDDVQAVRVCRKATIVPLHFWGGLTLPNRRPEIEKTFRNLGPEHRLALVQAWCCCCTSEFTGQGCLNSNLGSQSHNLWEVRSSIGTHRLLRADRPLDDVLLSFFAERNAMDCPPNLNLILQSHA